MVKKVKEQSPPPTFDTNVDATTTTDKDDDEDDITSSAWLWRLCLPLWLVYVSNQWSRSSLYALVDFSDGADATHAMNVALQFDQARYGVLASVAFTALFAVASVGAGAAADRWNRKTLTVLSAVGWTVATLGTAWATSYPTVLVWRVAMGLACAFATPTAYTLIRQRAPAARVALASSIYGTGVAVASALCSLTIVLDNEYGWRSALVVVAVGGGVAALAALLTLEDDTKETVVDNTLSNTLSLNSFVGDLQQVVETPRVQWMFLAAFFRFSAGLCIGVWGAPYFRMAYPDRQADFAVAQAAISAVGATLSGLLGGATADWLASQAAAADDDDTKDPTGRRLWVPVVGSLLAVPTWYLAVHAENTSFEVAMLWLAAEYFVAECWFGPTISTLQSTVDAKVGGTAQGAFTLTGGVANLAPSLLGYFYGQATSSATAGSNAASEELSTLLALGVCGGYLISAVCFAVAAQSPPSASAKVKSQ